MRAYFHIRRKGNELLRKNHFDLVYFSTTAFHVMALGPEWKKKFKVPFIVDIQDPWRNDFYLDKPAAERPPKFFIAYNIDKYLEAKTIPFADGIISVSQGYCDTLMQRYPSVTNEKCRVITFGMADADIRIMKTHVKKCDKILFPADKIKVLYIGRGGYDMAFAVNIIFKAFAKGLQADHDKFSKMHFWFIGTSYAPAGTGKKTIEPIAVENNVGEFVTEITDRITYFETLYLLNEADILFIPGSVDNNYTASKIYPYIILQKPMLAVFNEKSNIVNLLDHLGYGEMITFDHLSKKTEDYVEACLCALNKLLKEDYNTHLNATQFEGYKALSKTKEQVEFFNLVIGKTNLSVAEE